MTETIWIARLLCPKHHVMISGATVGNEDPAYVRSSFAEMLADSGQKFDCQICKYSLDLRRPEGVIEMHVQAEPTAFKTLKEAAALIIKEADRLRRADLLYRSRN